MVNEPLPPAANRQVQKRCLEDEPRALTEPERTRASPLPAGIETGSRPPRLAQPNEPNVAHQTS
jgi:hypothetical protein